MTPGVSGTSPPPRLLRWLAVAVAAAVLLVLGALVERLQEHEALRVAAGADLDVVRAALADGSGARTAWPGWLAAGLFGLSLRRVMSGPPELPMGVGPEASVAALRGAMRRELRWVQVGVVAVAGVAVFEVGRVVATGVAAARGVASARVSVGWALVETGGVLAAAAVLALHYAAFRRQCADLGAV